MKLTPRGLIRFLAVSGLVLLVGSPLAGLLQSGRTPHCSRSDFDLIEKGMALATVESVLGGPPGDYTSRPYVPSPLGFRYADDNWKCWVGDEGMILVDVDSNSYVIESKFAEILLEPNYSWLENIKARLRGR